MTEKAIETSNMILGVVCKDGVVLATEKVIVSKLMVAQTDKRIYSMSLHAGILVNGVIPDGRNIMYRGRSEYKSYLDMFGTEITGRVLAERLGGYMHQNTCYWGYRPYGTSCLISTFDPLNGYSLFMLEPSGTCNQYWGAANGRGKQGAKSEIEKLNFKDMSVEESYDHLAKILLKFSDETKDKDRELEFSVISDATDHKHKKLSAQQCDEIKARVEEQI